MLIGIFAGSLSLYILYSSEHLPLRNYILCGLIVVAAVLAATF